MRSDILNRKWRMGFAIIFALILLLGCAIKSSPVIKPDKPMNSGNNIGNLMNMGLLSYDADNIYYNHISDESIWITKIDHLGNRTKLVEGDGWYLNVIEDWLYYVNSDDNKIYRVSTNGKNFEKVSDLEVSFLYAYDGLFYIITSIDDAVHNLYTINYDGTDLKPICDDKVSEIYICSDSIYYYTYHDQKSFIYRINLDGSDKQEVKRDKEEGIHWLCVYENNIYYMGASNTVIMKLDMSSGVVSKVESTEMQYGVIVPDYIVSHDNAIVYYEVGHRAFKKLNLDTDETSTLYAYELVGSINTNSTMFPCLSIVGEDMYYYWDGRLNKINLNDGNLMKID